MARSHLLRGVRLDTIRNKHDARASFITVEKHPLFDGGKNFGPLAPINVFVGPNNCGKSRFLRYLAEHIMTFSSVATVDEDEQIAEYIRTAATPWLEEVRSSFKTRSNDRATSQPRWAAFLGGDWLAQWEATHARATTWVHGHHSAMNSAPVTWPTEAINAFNQLHPRIQPDRQSRTQPDVKNVKRCYIPVLRGLRPFIHAKDSYLDRTASDYGVPFKELSQTGLHIIDIFQDMRLGPRGQRTLLDRYEEFLSRWFFAGKRVELTAVRKREGRENDVLHIGIDGRTERPVFELGDGLSQLVIYTFPLFQYESNHLLLFIEEPENSLHPAFQRQLIEAILGYEFNPATKRQLFITTHSPVFLDATLAPKDVSIFRIRRNDTKEEGAVDVIPLSNADHPLLRDLGVSNSMVLLANCTIWVEGITDRMYFRRYLELYWRKHAKDKKEDHPYRENLHYVFVEYSGGNIEHWSFLDATGPSVDRLCGELILIADSDGEAKLDRKEKLGERLGDRFVELKCREVENLLSPTVLMKLIESYEGGIDALKEPSWTDYANEYLGTFIESMFSAANPSKRKGKPPYKAPSGTIKDKSAFAEKALAVLTDWDDLSDEAKRVTTLIVKHIEKHNSRPAG